METVHCLSMDSDGDSTLFEHGGRWRQYTVRAWTVMETVHCLSMMETVHCLSMDSDGDSTLFEHG